MIAAQAPSPGEERHMATQDATQLRSNSIGLIDVVFQSVTYMAPAAATAFSIGIGVGLAGTALPLSALVALVACTFCAIAIGQLGKFIPSAGGLYVFAARGLGPIVGFFVGWLYVGFSLFLPPFLFILNGWFIDTTMKSQGWWSGSPGWWFWGGLTALAVFCLTYFDIRLSAKAGIILGLIEIIAFMALSLTMVGEGGNSTAPFHPGNAAGGNRGIFQASVFVITAFIGFEAASALGEESRNPRRNVPRGIVYSCIAIGLFYLFNTYAWNVGADMNIVAYHTKTGGNDWVELAKQYWSNGWVLIFFALINSNTASATAATNNCSRVLFSMGRSGSLPAIMGRVHRTHRTPHVAVIFSVVGSCIVSVLASWKFDASLAFGVVGTAFTILAIIVYMISCAACIGFFNGEAREHRNVLLHVVVPILGIAVFAAPLYAQYFSLDKLFDYVLAYPFNWGGIGALLWVLVGFGITAVMAMTRRDALEASTRGFAGEAVEDRA
jgi:amino acid transporter